ncbi:MAG: hypothetical protein ACWA44_10830 [Thiotrichales bacterium]
MKHKNLRSKLAPQTNNGVPSTAQMEQITSYLVGEISEDELYVRTMFLAHNAIDRDQEVISGSLLADLARTLPGKGLHIRHPMGFDGDTGPGEGRFFWARVLTVTLDEARDLLKESSLTWPSTETQAQLLEASFYTVRTTDNAQLLKKIDAGIAGDVSIGFTNAQSEPLHGAEGEVIAQLLKGPGEAYEGSLVWLGAQPGARITKAATRAPGPGVPKSSTVKSVRDPSVTARALGKAPETINPSSSSLRDGRVTARAMGLLPSYTASDLKPTKLRDPKVTQIALGHDELREPKRKTTLRDPQVTENALKSVAAAERQAMVAAIAKAREVKQLELEAKLAEQDLRG